MSMAMMVLDGLAWDFSNAWFGGAGSTESAEAGRHSSHETLDIFSVYINLQFDIYSQA
jgi:hypothetical protein